MASHNHYAQKGQLCLLVEQIHTPKHPSLYPPKRPPQGSRPTSQIQAGLFPADDSARAWHGHEKTSNIEASVSKRIDPVGRLEALVTRHFMGRDVCAYVGVASVLKLFCFVFQPKGAFSSLSC